MEDGTGEVEAGTGDEQLQLPRKEKVEEDGGQPQREEQSMQEEGGQPQQEEKEARIEEQHHQMEYDVMDTDDEEVMAFITCGNEDYD